MKTASSMIIYDRTIQVDAKLYEPVTTTFELSLPPYDKALGTRRLCIAGCAISWLVGLTCLGLAVYMTYIAPDDPVFGFTAIPEAAQVIAGLVLNMVVTICTDSLGFAHTTSLRWHLWQEGRLAYNSNLRLLTGSKTSITNKWFTNLVLSIALVLCYTASSQVFFTAYDINFNTPTTTSTRITCVNGVALFILGFGIIIQAVVATICFSSHSKAILSWSSNPLNTALACHHHGLEHRNGRSMLSVEHASQPARPLQPQPRQVSARKISVAVRRIEYLVWTMFILAILWASIIIAVDYHIYAGEEDMTSPSLSSASVWFLLGNGSVGTQHLLALLVVAALQSLVTLGTHCTELLVNRSRDEMQWRRATVRYEGGTTAKGAPIRYNSAVAAATTWQSIILFAFKPVIHWLFGLGLFQDNSGSLLMNMSYLPLFLLAGVAFLLATFSTLLAWSRPKGYQPGTWGHLQTLVDLVDDWGAADSKVLYWGDKGLNRDGTRHAGTSVQPHGIGAIEPNANYR